jgi:pimeloyl-ACP methyl ester carboxylesterase
MLAIAIFLGMPAITLGASFIPALAAAQGGGRWASRCVWTARAASSEGLELGRAIFAMILSPRRRSAQEDCAAGGRNARPILLIHGIVCNRAVWRPWYQHLQAAGFAPVRAVDLEPLFGDIDAYAGCVAQELRSMQTRCGGARVTILAHSMGGLVARAALCMVGPDVIRQIVTLGSPHHGTVIARRLPWRLARQMRPGSPWLRALKARQAPPFAVPVTSIYSLQDNVILPARSAALAGARLYELQGLGHMGLVGSRRSIDCTVAALTGA